MKIYRIPFFDEYHCLMGDCPIACCRGWKIPIDPESYKTYKSTKGKLGLQLRFAMGKEEGFPVFSPSARCCHFYTKEGLCGLQLEKGESFIPGICRRFPRRFKNYGAFCEESLELACPASALLFLSHRKHENPDFIYVPTDGEPTYPDTTENNDYLYLNRLVDCRAGIIESLLQEDTLPLFAQLIRLQKYGHALQMHCAITGFNNPTPDLSAISISEISLSEKEILAPYLFDAKDTDALMCSGIYHINLRKRLPMFYQICLTYYSLFDPLTKSQADDLLAQSFKDFFNAHPDAISLLRDYYIYYLETTFLQNYEDYSFQKNLSMGAMHVHFLLLFLCLYERQGNEMNENNISKTIAIYERHMRHNDDLTDTLWKILPKKF
ncbi:MAG: hypothetical protein E7282_01760 [Lachnospiraceae bacterium]|nr:hypothetical protein [Lachnospiraceae bacterium]